MLGANLDRLRTLDGVKWTYYGDQVIPSWVADMDFDPAEPIKNAMRAVIDRGDFGYNLRAKTRLIEAYGDWQERHFGYRPPSDECQVYTATLQALAAVVELMTEPGDGVVVFTPIYHPFLTITEKAGRRIIDVPLDPDGWRLDPERFQAAIDETTKLVLFANPHNPLGRMFGADELKGFAEVVERNDLLLVSDEIWCDLTYGGNHIPTLKLCPELAERTITLGSASKSFNLAGLKTAVVHVASPAIRERFDALADHMMGGPSTLGIEASIAAWNQCGDWLDKVKAQLKVNRDHLVSRVANDLDGVTMHTPEATYLGWLDFSATSLADDPASQLRAKAGVGLQAGSEFSADWGSHARLNFATGPEVLDRIVDSVASQLR